MLFFILGLSNTDAVSQEQSSKEGTNVVIDSDYIKLILLLLTKSITIEVKLFGIQVEKASLQNGTRFIVIRFFDIHTDP